MGGVKKRAAAIEARAASLSGTGDELVVNMNETAEAMGRISASIDAVKGRLSMQFAAKGSASDALRRIASHLDELNAELDCQSSGAAESSAAVEAMLERVRGVIDVLIQNEGDMDALAQASEAGRAGLQEVAGDIQEIARQSEGLGEINAVMQNIASQTNLLSMNAAIEAAHAGEAGRGFAVVADEIRKLAENSGVQSKTIGAALQKIKEAIDKITGSTARAHDTFGAVDGGVKTVSHQAEGIRLAMEEEEACGKRMLDAMINLNDGAQTLKARSAGALAASKEALAEGDCREGAAREITSDLEGVGGEAEQAGGALRRMNEIGEKNKEHIRALLVEVSRFNWGAGADAKAEGLPEKGAGNARQLFQYEWNRAFSVGNDFIDGQHKELFAKVNGLLRAIQEGKGKDELKTALDFLNDYTIKHFFDEEQLQIKSKYPDHPRHRQLHEAFKATVRGFSNDLIMRGVSAELLDDVRKKIGSWLIAHIKVEDVKLGRYLQSQNGGTRAA
jgi:hemerythrin-like metal-binding protein